MSHQRCHGTSCGWTNLGATTTSATKDVSSATRGTRKFRVVTSHAVVGSAESAPVYVTWDEWDIMAAMVGELSAAVATSTAYGAARRHGRGLQRRPRATAANASRALAAVSRAESSMRTFFFSVSSGIVEKTSSSSSALSAV